MTSITARPSSEAPTPAPTRCADKAATRPARGPALRDAPRAPGVRSSSSSPWSPWASSSPRRCPALRPTRRASSPPATWKVRAADLRFGIAHLLWATVASSIVALVDRGAVRDRVALFLTQYSPRWLRRPPPRSSTCSPPCLDRLRPLGRVRLAAKWAASRTRVLASAGSRSSATPAASPAAPIFFVGLVLADHDPAHHHRAVAARCSPRRRRPTRRPRSPSARPAGR